ncbi:integrase core domain-containing protein [[Pseudopropionibacterium] massiliense]|uniref:integrase core domain-containing protein n=1 Tax=[Pseudopropionibacterium] massiliense TaxID=2220000 RepID=UPI0010303F09|nr:integrase core domain-containing protein [[Pseudopropionibacterium] massiliense]
MKQYGVLTSLGRIGVRYDNATAESFNATPKKELVNRKIYRTRRKTIKDVTSWIEHCHKQTTLHSSPGYRTPNEVLQG